MAYDLPRGERHLKTTPDRILEVAAQHYRSRWSWRRMHRVCFYCAELTPCRQFRWAVLALAQLRGRVLVSRETEEVS